MLEGLWRKGKPPNTTGENVNWCSCYGEQYEISLKKLKIEGPYDPVITFQNIYLEKMKTLIRRGKL